MNDRRKHIRLTGWDYSSEGTYFITICCQNREFFFGKIFEGKVNLSEIGLMASIFWQEIPVHFKHVKLDDFVIMPNHLHGILTLNYSRVGTCHGMTLPDPESPNKSSKPLRSSVSVIINQYKSTLKRWCNKNGFRSFHWQSRFYDQILHNDIAIQSVREYIRTNPKKWDLDEMFCHM